MACKSIAVNHGRQLIVDQDMAMIPFAYLSGGVSNAIVMQLFIHEAKYRWYLCIIG